MTSAFQSGAFQGDAFQIDAAPSTNYTLICNAGSYVITGQTAALLQSRLITAQTGTYTETGVSAVVKVDKKLTASAGSYAVTGQNATITRTGGAVGYTITAQTGQYSLGGYWVDGYVVDGYVGNATITIGQRPRGASTPKMTQKQAKKPILNDDDEVFEILSILLEEIA